MLTVGDMVEARANALGTGICIPAPGDVAVVPATVPPSMVEDILQSLGIWDAEVLELPVCRLHCADCAFHLQFPSVLLPEPGQTVRVIVPKEGKK